MATIQGIYLALFGRPADPAGLAYFNGITKNGTDLAGIGNLAGQKEYTDRFVNKTPTEIINSIYQSLFGRDGEANGVAFWTNKLATGALTINNIAVAILDGALGSDKTIITAKIAAADLFTAHLDLPAEQQAYNANTLTLARDYITTIGSTHAGTGTEVDAVIARMLTSAGQAPVDGGGDTSAGGGNPPAVLADFTITQTEGGLKFGGSATGEITLGFDEDYHLTGSRGGVVATITDGPIIVSESDGAINLFESDGPIHVSKSYVAISALPEALVLENGLHVGGTADVFDGKEVSGNGSVQISAADGSQNLIVHSDGDNFIDGGLGADVIDLGQGSIELPSIDLKKVAIAEMTGGHDVIIETGVTQEQFDEILSQRKVIDDSYRVDADLAEKQSALAADISETKATADLEAEESTAKKALDDLGERDTLTTKLTAAQNAETARPGLEKTWVDAHNVTEKAEDDVTAKAAVSKTASDYAARVDDAAFKGIVNTAITKAFHANPFLGLVNRSDVTNAINALKLDATFTDKLNADIPKASNFITTSDLNSYLLQVAKDITANVARIDGEASTAAKALAASTSAELSALYTESNAKAALDAHIKEYGASTDLHTNTVHAQDAIDNWDEANNHLEDATAAVDHRHTLEADVATAQDAVDHRVGLINDLHNAIDKLANIESSSDVGAEDKVVNFQVGTDILKLPGTGIVEEGTITVSGITVSSHDGILTFSRGDSPLKITADELSSVLNIMKDDPHLGYGVTAAFAYETGDEHGVYVFQGSAGNEHDIGVKLVGLDIGSVDSVNQLISSNLPA